MKGFPIYISILFLLAMSSCSKSQNENSESTETSPLPAKVITAGGTITETLYALGVSDLIIATDRTSTFPAEMQALPSIGYRNQIKAEGILSLGADLVLIEEGYLNEEVVTQLKSSGQAIEIILKPSSVEETKQVITKLGDLFDLEDKAANLNKQIDQDLADLNAYLETSESQPSAAFVMARGPETLFIAGEKTFAESMFELAGITSVASGFEEFVPLTPESLVSINPDYLVFFDSGIQSLGDKNGLANVQGIKETKAFQEDHIISMDGHYLSSFGPRVGQAALELAKAVRE
ncbi:heme/hemin ABC transporter substrate-binding protein [Algoriphagus vanfongensis]|uniref:heme/hemin ABC transporter substrate-binding protein n=1 Tax=Algoriphagus vanfongensis TaxID=426371 RepID=UPI00047A9098|nr:ABC transporter substrate-binding protein [Algoriphagus vanfongensis]